MPGSYDIRQTFKLNSVYELSFGMHRRFLAGAPFQLTSGRNGVNAGLNSVDTGVVLYNMTASQLQDMVQIRKTTGSWMR